MHPACPISDPRPGLTDRQFDQWLTLLGTLGTAAGLPRRLPKPQTLPEQWAYKPDMPAPIVSVAFAPVQDGQVHPLLPMSHTYIRSVEIAYHVPIDEWTGEPVSSHAPGSEVVLSAYLDQQTARLVLDEMARRRPVVRGVTFPEQPGLTERFFGPPETRFRTFDPEPYFPDATPGIHYVGVDRTKWNNYQLGRRCA